MKVLRKSTFLYGALAVSLLAMSVSAQADVPNLSSALKSQSVEASKKTATTSSKTSATKSSSQSASDSQTTDAPDTTDITSQRTSSKVVITGSGDANTNTAPPSITGPATATDGGALPTGLPTLSGQFKVVPASVPPTANAPFMRQSSLPEGTVFIIVGAVLGFLAMSVLLWRGLVAWSLHRSVKRAAQQQNMSDTKALFPPPATPFYKYSDRDSTISLGRLTEKGNKATKKSGRPTTAQGPGAASTSSLFFSPTAGAAGAGMHNSGNRGSNYLPAGYYAAGASAPGNNNSHVSVGGHGPSISLSNLGPHTAGYSRARSMGPSPPGSPGFSAQSGHHGMQSSSTINLTRGYGGDERAPSAYLEDLFDGEGGMPTPGQYGGHRPSGSQGRF